MDIASKQRADVAKLKNLASSLIESLNAPAVAHAVWVESTVGSDGEFINRLCMSVRPGFEDAVSIPTEHEGEPVKRVVWPEGE